MIEKPNKDGKPPTTEYQEEEILVSRTTAFLDIGSLTFHLSCYLLVFVGYCLWCSCKTMLQYVQGQFQFVPAIEDLYNAKRKVFQYYFFSPYAKALQWHIWQIDGSWRSGAAHTEA